MSVAGAWNNYGKHVFFQCENSWPYTDGTNHNDDWIAERSSTYHTGGRNTFRSGVQVIFFVLYAHTDLFHNTNAHERAFKNRKIHCTRVLLDSQILFEFLQVKEGEPVFEHSQLSAGYHMWRFQWNFYYNHRPPECRWSYSVQKMLNCACSRYRQNYDHLNTGGEFIIKV